MDLLTHAITEKQPRAWACAMGFCPVILSDTRPDMGREGELLGIHAALRRPSPAEVAVMPRPGEMRWPPGYTYGALIGVARLVGVVRAGMISGQFSRMVGRSVSASLPADLNARIRPWWRTTTGLSPGTKWGLLLSEAVSLSEPIPMRGSGGLWRLPGGRHYYVRDGCGDYAERDLTAAEWAVAQWRKARGTTP